MQQRVIIQWGVSSFFAWGIFGLNLALQWADDPDLEPVCGCHITPEAISLDPLRRGKLDKFFDLSAAFERQLQPMSDVLCEAHLPVLQALGADFYNPPNQQGVHLAGRPTIGVVVFETARLSDEAVQRAKSLPMVIAASEWNRRVMVAHGVERVETVLQGIDPTVFHPAPASGLFNDRFCIFSGGKLEYRKGQDIVLAAYARFAKDHPEALLVTAWQSPWPQVAQTLNRSSLVGPIALADDGRADVLRWAVENGVDARQVVDLGVIPNSHMATVLREMQVAVFPNRCEGGTNQVAMECMASGVPAILSQNTGHLDLIEEDNCYPLELQEASTGDTGEFNGVPGWGESNVDELVATLERVHAERQVAKERGLRGAAKLAGMTWSHTARNLKQIVLAQC